MILISIVDIYCKIYCTKFHLDSLKIRRVRANLVKKAFFTKPRKCTFTGYDLFLLLAHICLCITHEVLLRLA